MLKGVLMVVLRWSRKNSLMEIPPWKTNERLATEYILRKFITVFARAQNREQATIKLGVLAVTAI
jgi:hypothetical protein